MTGASQREIERYLQTGKTDALTAAWGSGPRAEGTAGADLKNALIEEVVRRSSGRRSPRVPRGAELRAFTRAKVESMVRGLFPAREQELVLAMLERSVVFLTRDNVEHVLREQSWLSTSWTLANLYLTSLGVEPLGPRYRQIDGLSEETTCYVSTEYFATQDRFADFVVHEAAHVFHNCKRGTVGLPETRRREWLLDIDFSKRETFAYGCEAYSRLLELGPRPADRRRLLVELLEDPIPTSIEVGESLYADMLREAVAARNGWKRILARCAPERKATAAVRAKEP